VRYELTIIIILKFKWKWKNVVHLLDSGQCQTGQFRAGQLPSTIRDMLACKTSNKYRNRNGVEGLNMAGMYG
jgi:hypothetical protein